MVYCGKPSKACTECRVRRTKCDTLKPSCSQCLRAGRVCGGYRDPADIIFRDQRQSLISKSQNHRNSRKDEVRPTQSKSGAIAASKPSVIEPNAEALIPSALIPSFGLHDASTEDHATCFFFSNYVLPSEEFSNGNFQYLSQMYCSNQAVGPALTDTVVSLGMAGLANFWKSRTVMANANKKYNSALRLVSSRLADIEEAKSDQTLVAVMLLGLYETNTCSGLQSMASWTKHIWGAAALLKLRGKQQLHTQVGHAVFVHLRTQIITNCLQRHVVVPPIISEWSREALSFENIEQAAATKLSEITIKFCNLRSSMPSFHDYSNMEYIISAACDIDRELANWVTECPFLYIYDTVTINERSEDIFSDHYFVYNNLWVATVWNHYRCARILTNELILDQMQHLYLDEPMDPLSLWQSPYSYENQMLASKSTLLQLSHDICASVPYFLGHTIDPAESMHNSPKTVIGNLLLWPLYTAAITAMVSDLLREWVAGRLMMISEVLGIRQAGPLAYSLRIRQDLLTWDPEADPDLSTEMVTETPVENVDTY